MYNQTVEPVTKFTFLGSDVDSEGYSTLLCSAVLLGLLEGWRSKKINYRFKAILILAIRLGFNRFDSL